MNIYRIFPVVFALIMLSCNPQNNEDCSLVDCAVSISYEGIHLYFLDKDTNENSIASGSLTIDDVEITDQNNNALRKELFEIETHDPENPFRSHILTFYDEFEEGEYLYNFKVKDTIEFKVKLNVNYNGKGCCIGAYLDNLEIDGIEHSLEYSKYSPIIYLD